MEDDPELHIEDTPEESRYQAFLGDVDVAFSEYETEPGRVIFTHTVVKPEFEGRGIGSRLAKHVVEDVRSRGLRITPVCPFIRAYLRRHREYDSIVDYPSAHRESPKDPVSR
jgi:predicted GNAT family acetyltransferase